MDPSSAESGVTRPRLCVFMLQLGAPTTISEIEPFLSQLLTDVLPVPAWCRGPLGRWIAKRRAPRVAPKYRAIGGGSPLLANTRAQGEALTRCLEERGYMVRVLLGMRYSSPRVGAAIETARRELFDATWVALPLYPQYSLSTTGSALMDLGAHLTEPERARLRTVRAYADDSQYLDTVAEQVRETLARFSTSERGELRVVFSAHSIPLRSVNRGDPYPEEVRQTVAGVQARLDPGVRCELAYQSRVGPARWLGPAVETRVCELAQSGVRHLVLVPISFVSEHLETLHDLDLELASRAREAGIVRFERVPAVGVRPGFIRVLADQVARAVDADRLTT